MRSFASDNNSGVHPLVMEALSRANADHALGYGDDQWTEDVYKRQFLKIIILFVCKNKYRWRRNR